MSKTVQQALQGLKQYSIQRIPEQFLTYKPNAATQKKIIYPVAIVNNRNGDVFNRMKDMFHQESFCEITSQSSKLRTYGKLKTEPGRETYLDGVKNISERTALTKLRLSNHDLLIEKGRHQGLSKHDRLCPFCENSI